MKVKLSTIYASPHLTAQPGSVIDVSEAEGKELLAGRFGVAIDTAPAAEETAATGAPENAARRTGRGKPRTVAAPSVPATE